MNCRQIEVAENNTRIEATVLCTDLLLLLAMSTEGTNQEFSSVDK